MPYLEDLTDAQKQSVDKQLKRFGTSISHLQQQNSKILTNLLNGRMTPIMRLESVVVVPIDENGISGLQEKTVKNQGKLSGYFDPKTDEFKMFVNYKRQNFDLKEEYFGVKFTEEEIKLLKETGTLGKLKEFTNSRGETYEALVTYDKDLNDMKHVKKEWLYVPDKIAGVVLTKEQKEDILNGKAVEIKGLQGHSGEFEVRAQLNAFDRKIQFMEAKVVTPEMKKFMDEVVQDRRGGEQIPERPGGVYLTFDQKLELATKDFVNINNAVAYDRAGNKYQYPEAHVVAIKNGNNARQGYRYELRSGHINLSVKESAARSLEQDKKPAESVKQAQKEKKSKGMKL